MKINRSIIALVLMAAFTGGCAVAPRPIADITQYPGRYDHRLIKIEGRVTQSFGGPLVPVSYYKVDDGTGEIIVLARGPAPRPGSIVRVSGRVDEVASFGTRTFGLHMQQERLSVRRW